MHKSARITQVATILRSGPILAIQIPVDVRRVPKVYHRSQAAHGTTRQSHETVHSAPYHAGSKTREFEKVEIDKMLEQLIIEPAQTERAAWIVVAPKKDKTFWFCVDYRKLIAVTNPNSYPIPKTDECIDSFVEATIFTTLHANRGYWKIKIEELDQKETAFTSHHGL